MKKFRHLNVPSHWEHYWSKYPEGYTILEALLNWVKQVDDMVDNVNDWNEYLEKFVETFDEKLRPHVRDFMQELVDNGKMAEIINEEIFGELNKKLEDVIEKTGVGINSLIGQGASTADIQEAINELAGEKIIIPPSFNLTIDAPLTLPPNTELVGYGAKITLSSPGTAIIPDSTSSIFGIEFNHLGVFNFDDQSIFIEGELTNYKHSIYIVDCVIKGAGGYGIHIEFGRDIFIKNPRLYDIGYGAVMGYSVENVHVFSGIIDGVYGDSSVPNAYGVAFTRRSTTDDVAVYPRSKNCSATFMTVDNVPKWEGLDTHGGESILFEHNTIKNCKVGVAMVPSTYAGSPGLGTHNCIVRFNTVYGRGTGAGISLAGTETDNGTANMVYGNTLIECGELGNNITGAIRTLRTVGTKVSDNTIIRPYEIGVNYYVDNIDFLSTGNTIIDPHSMEWAAASHIAAREGGNSGLISDNQFMRRDTALNEFVGVRSVYIASDNDIEIGSNIDRSERGPSGEFYSVGNELERLEPSAIVATGEDRGYSVQFSEGLTLTWKTVVVDATQPDVVQSFTFPEGMITSGHVSGSVTLASNTPTRHRDFLKMSYSIDIDGWHIRFSPEGESTELEVRLFAIGRTV